MKLLSYKFLFVFIYLLSTVFSFSNEINIKNLVVHKENKKLENVIFTDEDNNVINLNDFKVFR